MCNVEILAAVKAGTMTVEEASVALAVHNGNGRNISYKVSEKGALSAYGINSRMPVTMYVDQWTRIDNPDEVAKRKAFITAHSKEFSHKA